MASCQGPIGHDFFFLAVLSNSPKSRCEKLTRPRSLVFSKVANSLGFSRLNRKENRAQGKATYRESFSLTRHCVKIRKFKMLYFQKERRYGAGNFEEGLFLGQLQPTWYI